jgi:hypothetical protein
LEEQQQYSKFDWLEATLVKAKSDPRPESHNPRDMSELIPVGHIGTNDQWRERRQVVLKTAKVHTRLESLISGAKANEISLAVFKAICNQGYDC